MQDSQKPGYAKEGLTLLTIITGMMFYFPIYLVKDGYLKVSEYDFGKNVLLLILSLICLLASLLVWRKIYFQFQNDRTKLGFSKDTNGYIVLVSAIIGGALTLLGWLHFV